MDQPRTTSLALYQQEIALLIAEGLADAQLGERLALGCSQIAHHIEDIVARLGVGSRMQIAAWAEAYVPTGSQPVQSAKGPR